MTTEGLLSAVTPPLDGKPFRWSVGTRPAGMSQWLAVDDTRHRTMVAKDAVLDNHLGQTVITTPAGRTACDELLQATLAHLQEWHTGEYDVTDNAIIDLHSQRRTHIDTSDPLQTLARALPQDLCVLTSVDDRWTLTAAAVCFTSRWNLSSKIGCDLNQIHAPVPGYEQRIAAAVDHVMNRLGTDQVLQRSNWTLLDTDELHLPEPAQSRPVTGDVWDLRWLRIERQSLHRLTDTDAVIFTIDTRVYRVDELEPSDRRRLHDSVVRAPAEIATYKGWPVGPTQHTD